MPCIGDEVQSIQSMGTDQLLDPRDERFGPSSGLSLTSALAAAKHGAGHAGDEEVSPLIGKGETEHQPLQNVIVEALLQQKHTYMQR